MLIKIIHSYIYPEKINNLLPLSSAPPAQNVQVFVKVEVLELKFPLKKATQVAEDKYFVLVPSLQKVNAYWVVDLKFTYALNNTLDGTV
jgi:hypothetical protein